MRQHFMRTLQLAELYQRHGGTMQRGGMIRKLHQTALEERQRTIMTLGQLAERCGKFQLLYGHGHVRRCPYQVLGCACMIALSGSDVAETFQSFTVIGNARQNTLQQTGGLAQLTGRGTVLRGGENTFNFVIHGDVKRVKSRLADEHGAPDFTTPRIVALETESRLGRCLHVEISNGSDAASPAIVSSSFHARQEELFADAPKSLSHNGLGEIQIAEPVKWFFADF
jgi:hypothetical protein